LAGWDCVFDACAIELLGDCGHELIASSALARLFIIQVQHFSVVAISYQLDLRLRNRVSQRSLGQQFLCALEYSVELDLHGLHAALGFAVVLCGKRALQPNLLRLPVAEHARNSFFKVPRHLLPRFKRAVSVLVQPHPKRHLAHHRLIPPAAGEALEVACYSGMTGTSLIPGAPYG
jgi:hypothetical protein